MSKVFKAVECFNNGFNCAQAVFSTYTEELGMDPELARKASCGFGAGMGRLCETCGAVSGAYLLIGLKYGMTNREDNEAKEKTYELVREFSNRFKQRNGFTGCRELLGIELTNPDRTLVSGRVKAVCPKAVQDAAEIVEELLGVGKE